MQSDSDPDSANRPGRCGTDNVWGHSSHLHPNGAGSLDAFLLTRPKYNQDLTDLLKWMIYAARVHLSVAVLSCLSRFFSSVTLTFCIQEQ